MKKKTEIIKEQQETIDKATKNSRMYMNRLIVVALFANQLVKAAVEDDRYYFRVSKQRVNTLKEALKALREHV